jgi:NTP pyrophosphatase (non-canonical NTP hydrolase)
MIMANSLDIDLTEVFEENMEKFNRRDSYRFERKDGKQTAENK